MCYRFPCLNSSLVSVYTTEPAGIPTGSDYLMCSNIVTVGENEAHEHLFIFCFVGAPSRNRTGTSGMTSPACCRYTIRAPSRMCERRSDAGKRKGRHRSAVPFLLSGVSQVYLVELVSSKCTGKEKGDTEVPPYSQSEVCYRFPCPISSVVSVRETNSGSHEEATSRHLLVTP